MWTPLTAQDQRGFWFMGRVDASELRGNIEAVRGRSGPEGGREVGRGRPSWWEQVEARQEGKQDQKKKVESKAEQQMENRGGGGCC